MHKPYLAFDKNFFAKHQRVLLWLLNTPVISRWFRWVLRLNGDRSSVGDRRIEAIQPYAITWKKKQLSRNFAEFETEYRNNPRYGKRLYYAFRPLWWTLHFYDWLLADRFAPQFSFGFATLTFNPDAHTEVTSVDGSVQRDAGGAGEVWATIRSGAGTAANDNATTMNCAVALASGTTNQWAGIGRSIYLFPTSSLPDAAVTSAAVLSVYVQSKYDGLGATLATNVYATTPASNTALVNADYGQFGTTALATAISWASLPSSGYADFNLNASGIAAISTTGVSKYGIRFEKDASNTAPTWVAGEENSFIVYTADDTNGGRDPKLVVTYTASTTYTQSVPATATAAVSLSKGLVKLKALTQTATAAITLAKTQTAVRALAVTSAAVLALSQVRIYLKTLAVGGVAATSGPASPGTLSDDSGIGTLSWSNPSNAASSNDSYATVTTGVSGTTHYLKATNFGFSIPSDATIQGISVSIERKGTGGGSNRTRDSVVKLVKADGTLGTTNKADAANNWPSTDTVKIYGDASDLWGDTWSYADINDADFGVVLAAAIVVDTSVTSSVDHVTITVHYTQGGTGAQAVATLSRTLTAYSALAVTSNAIVALSRAATYLKTLTQTATASVSLAHAATFYRTLTTMATAVIDLVWDFIVVVALSATASAVTSISRAFTYARALTLSAVSIVSISQVKTYYRTLAVTATSVITLTKGLVASVTLAITALAVPALSRLATHVRSLAVTATGFIRLYVNGLLARFSKKYPDTETTYAKKFPAASKSYTKKYPSSETVYEKKYPDA
jgi:hypothetical protein